MSPSSSSSALSPPRRIPTLRHPSTLLQSPPSLRQRRPSRPKPFVSTHHPNRLPKSPHRPPASTLTASSPSMCAALQFGIYGLHIEIYGYPVRTYDLQSECKASKSECTATQSNLRPPIRMYGRQSDCTLNSFRLTVPTGLLSASSPTGLLSASILLPLYSLLFLPRNLPCARLLCAHTLAPEHTERCNIARKFALSYWRPRRARRFPLRASLAPTAPIPSHQPPALPPRTNDVASLASTISPFSTISPRPTTILPISHALTRAELFAYPDEGCVFACPVER
ncbi:uncharacterized protein SCHCODRAFT_02515184 [Schizophyllum commune H4-8]|nr:uncharacterized protein SCHCODRAFT_02515184 [Schizophyllum commune H4-8]KAI5887739.1 hypothetical protein SCHCODRAFT_02515184 [Schizophyllum commune H4-8]